MPKNSVLDSSYIQIVTLTDSDETSLLFFQVRQRGGKCEGCTFHGADNGGEQELSHYRQNIERLWRYVYENVLDLFYTIFTQLEIQGLLNPGEEIDLFALHRCFLHHIQHHLQSFQEAWNQHGLRTANNHSPLHLWLMHRKEGQDLSQVDEDYGVDWTGPHNHRPSNEITIPEIQLPRALNEGELAVLPNNNVSLSQALDAYCETVQSLKLMFDNTP
ncbi:PH-interacting protein [Sarotherodon galilaeus]